MTVRFKGRRSNISHKGNTAKKLLHVSERTLRNWHKAVIFCYSTIGGKCYYKLSDIRELLEKNKGKGSRNKDKDEGLDKEE